MVSILGARLSNSTPRKGSDPSCSVSIVNLTEEWQWLSVRKKWSAVTLSGIMFGGFIKPVIGKGFVSQYLNRLVKRHICKQRGYEQIDGVAMGSPLGSLLANVFMCSIEETLQQDDFLPPFYRRYVDDTLTIMPDRVTADHFLRTLNHCHSSVRFTMETEHDGSLPFLGVELLNRAPKIETKVYIKPTNTSLLLHYQSHVDYRYKRSLINTMLDRAY